MPHFLIHSYNHSKATDFQTSEVDEKIAKVNVEP
jgi:hypothetical protein